MKIFAVDYASTASTDAVLVINAERGRLRQLVFLREVRGYLALVVDEVFAAKKEPPPAIALPPVRPLRPPGRNPYVAPRQRPPKTLGVKRR